MKAITQCKKKIRDVEIEIGKQYQVQPLNPRKLKNRRRQCLVLDMVPLSKAHPNYMVAKVRYLDNNRIGKVDLEDLVPM